MEKNVIVAIKSFSDLDDDAIEVVTPGVMTEENEICTVVYEESELSGMNGTTTTLIIEENKLTLKRVGSTNTVMEFEEKKNSVCMYNTPYGMLNLTIDTERVEIDMCEAGGIVYAKYGICTDGQPPIMTQLSIKIKVK